MNSRIQSLIGLARRAGKVASGEAQVEALLKKRMGYCLILAEDAPGAQKKFEHWATDLKLPVVITGTKHELGYSIGLSPRSAVLILDQGFAKAILLARS
ncbi:ribosomal protein HS6-type (S12/L30/L7a) [Desulfosporosinus acidiphilus SJ4]|uniref:Ribosomal protein HS6-type (S12/L30/L7a) n=1 Tax=Desulfosporosinus acidiphilus (strain DSM 22704 / JCM 16185 / SJ4) TaxID=646529 RepID=I4D9F2_DESAJ|nr:ribosomal L7Ae/L30e/S12e/Gadd45 family protein [Desulfosporosinus acidiphilus]AFM42426.1 ribosomal protein HS6-type (S12/L30/L7a) [Desulfosporosinus acidiphilus SJ4]